jgi:hypothetical protein
MDVDNSGGSRFHDPSFQYPQFQKHENIVRRQLMVGYNLLHTSHY